MRKKSFSQLKKNIPTSIFSVLIGLSVIAGLVFALIRFLPYTNKPSISENSIFCVSLPTPSPIPETPRPSPSSILISTPNPDGLDAVSSSYTFAWISDTQNYFKRDRTDIFEQMVDFTVSNSSRMNTRYLIHTGDIVQDYNNENQWRLASDIMDRLNGLPYGVLAGNHDTGGKGDFSYYKKHFGPDRFKNSRCFGDSLSDNSAHYDIINAGGSKYLFVYLSYGADSAARKWVKSVFDQYPDHIGILCLHDYFDTDMSLLSSGKEIYDSIVMSSPNVYLVLCGHRYNVGYDTAHIENPDGSSRTVHQIMMNYQAAGSIGGSGYMMYIQVREDTGELSFINYSPYTGDHRYYDNPGTEKEKYPMDPSTEEFSVAIPW